MEQFGDIAQLAGGLGAFSLVVWVVRRVFTHTIPRLAKSFEEALKLSQQQFHDELKSCRDDFREELRAQRLDFKSQIHEERELFLSRLDRMSDAIMSLERAIVNGRTGGGV